MSQGEPGSPAGSPILGHLPPPGPAGEGIRFVDRRTGQLVEEVVYSRGIMAFMYDHFLGRLLARVFIRRWFSRLYGLYLDSRLSRGKIGRFIAELSLDTSEQTRPVDDYESFNAFFARSLKPEARPLDPDPAAYLSGCDARTLAFATAPTSFPIKGQEVDLAGFLGDRQLADRLAGGAVIVYRLCPSDYHRFHFPDAGRAGPARRIPGRYHSVSPYALEKGIPVFLENVREVSVLESESFGVVAIVEVGAIGVGGIVQTYEPDQPVARGAEKGYFEFGGSTVVHVVEAGRLELDRDLLEATAAGYETLVLMGSSIGRRVG